MPDTLKLVFAPWGVNDYGADVWLLENALVFGIESLIEKLTPAGGVQYADLYAQMMGEQSRTTAQPPLTEAQLFELADRAPAGTSGIIDGQLIVKRGPETLALVEAQFAPRLLILPQRRWETPDAFVFTGFAPHQNGRDSLELADPAAFFWLGFQAALALLSPLGIVIPRDLNAEDLAITESWPAYTDFLKAKRLARTPEEKLGYYRQAAKKDAGFYWTRFNGAQILKAQEDYHGARRLLMECVNAADGDRALLGDAYFEMGLCSIYLGDTKTARNFWDEALRYAPDNPSLLVNIGGTYEQEEDWQQAMALYAQALEADPRYHKAIVSLARLKAARGKMDEAISLYERALEIQPQDALRQAILGGCYLATDNREKAREHFNLASQMDPAQPARPAPAEGEEAQPAPGDYAREELAKLAALEAEAQKPKKGWRLF